MTTLQMSQAVQERLKKHMGDSDQLILDFDDGVGAYLRWAFARWTSVFGF